MTIYTKTGDKGTTALFGGKRVSKHDVQIEAYGSIDEATCFIGLAYELIKDKQVKDLLTAIQYNLYKIMAYLSGANLPEKDIFEHISDLEKEIDKTFFLFPFSSFIFLNSTSQSIHSLYSDKNIVF